MSYRPESAGHPPHYSRDSAKGIEQRLSSQACGPLKSALQLRATCSGAELACIGVCLVDRRPNRSSISMSMPAWRNSAPGLFHPSAEARGQSKLHQSNTERRSLEKGGCSCPAGTSPRQTVRLRWPGCGAYETRAPAAKLSAPYLPPTTFIADAVEETIRWSPVLAAFLSLSIFRA